MWRRVAVYPLCRDDGGRILLTRVSLPGLADDGKWTMPGGSMEFGETIEQAGLRELAEETGLSCTIGGVLGVFSHWYTADESFRGEAGHAVGLIVDATELAGELRSEFDEGTTDAAAWFSLDEVQYLERVELLDFVLTLIR